MTASPHAPHVEPTDLECASCGEETHATELLALAGGPSPLSLRLVLCLDCRDEEIELGGEG